MTPNFGLISDINQNTHVDVIIRDLASDSSNKCKKLKHVASETIRTGWAYVQCDSIGTQVEITYNLEGQTNTSVIGICEISLIGEKGDGIFKASNYTMIKSI